MRKATVDRRGGVRQARPANSAAELRELNARLTRELQFETLIAELSTTFINISPGEAAIAIRDAQRRVCEFLDLDLSVVWEWSGGTPPALTITHLYRSRECPAPPARIDAQDVLPWSFGELMAGRIVAASVDSAPPGAERDSESWRRYGIRTTLMIPLSAGGGPVIGAVSFDSLRDNRTWTQPLIDRVRLVPQIFANTLVRIQYDEALRESDARLNVAMEGAGASLWSVDAGALASRATARVHELVPFGPGEDLAYRRFLGAIHPGDRDAVVRSLRRALRTGARLVAEYRTVQPDGTVRWISARGRRYPGVDGRPDCLIGVSVDVTDRKRAEEALRASEEVNRATFEQAAVGIAHVGPDGRWLRVNARLCQIVGYSAEELLNTSFQDLTHPDDLDTSVDYLRRMLSGEIGTFSLEKRYVRRDGAAIWVNLAVSLVRDALGRPNHFITVVEDVTERKENEAELQRLRLDFWHADRVAQTGAITASIAHELNQPLAAILANAQAALRIMAHREFDADEIRAILADIVQDDKRAASVITGLRSMLRRRSTRRETIGLEGTIRTVVELVHSEMLAHEVDLQVQLDGIECPVRADEVQLQQVLLNLLMNAVQAMQDEPVAQRVLVVTLTRSETEAEISVRDSGPGIPEDLRAKVFDAFWTTKQEGLGIGLAISRSILESHGGRLWFTCNPDRGMTFHLALPIEDPSA